MNRLKTWFGNTFWNGYSVWERLFLFGMLALQVIVFCFNPDTPLNIIAGFAGVLSVVLCAKGKLANYFIGFIQNFTYTILAFQNQFYGEVIEQGFYIVTMIWGIFVWKANMDKAEDGTSNVMTKKFTPLQWVLSIVGTIIVTLGFGYFLQNIGSAQAYTDAATNVMALFAQIMMVRRYREQWIWWLVIDVFCIKLWWVAGNWSMVAMYIAWTINCIYGWYNWSKLNKQQTAVKANV